MRDLLLPFDEVRERFVQLATGLSTVFPELDLRFNLRAGSPKCRVFAGSLSRRVLELELDCGEPHQIFNEAVWEIKRLTGIMDA